MNELIAKAEYMIALETNTITNEIRNNYALTLDIDKNGIEIFELIVEHALKGIKDNTLTTEEAFKLIQNEYIILDFSKILGNFNNYIDFINLLINITASNKIDFNILEELIIIVDNMPIDIKTSTYIMVLISLINSKTLTQYLNFSNEIILYLKNVVTIVDRLSFYNILHKTINTINFSNN